MFNRGRRRYWPNLKKTFYLLVFFLLLSLSLFLHQRYFVIHDIFCQVNTGTCPQSVSHLLSQNLGRSLLTINHHQIKNEINQAVQPETIKIKPKLPGQLIVKLEYSSFQLPIGLITNSDLSLLPPNPSTIALLNSLTSSLSATPKTLLLNGQLLDSDHEYRLIIISPSVKEEPDTYARLANIINYLGRTSISYTKGYFLPPNLLLQLSSNQIVILTVNQAPETQIRALQQILSNATIKDGHLIDLRFNRPVVK